MIKHVERSVIPIYLSAAAWLIFSLFLPMKRLSDYLIYIGLTIAVYLIGRKFFPDSVSYTEAPEKAPDSGNAEVDALLVKARADRQALLDFGSASENELVVSRTRQLFELAGKIMAALEKEPDRVSRARKFLDYYLPSTVKLLERYRELEKQKVSGPNISDSMTRIENMLLTVQEAYQKQLDSLYQADAMDITADIAVMEQIMKSEGLLAEKV